MKYLRFRLKRSTKKFTTKGVGVGGGAEGLFCPRIWRKQGPSCNRYKEGPYWARMCRLCSQLCRRAPAPATSPLPLWAFERAAEFRFYTELIAQQQLCVRNKKAPPNSWPTALADLASQIHPNTHIHPKLTPSGPPPVDWNQLCFGCLGHEGISVHLAPNCFWLMEGPFYVTYAIFGSQDGGCIGGCVWVMMSQGHCKERATVLFWVF